MATLADRYRYTTDPYGTPIDPETGLPIDQGYAPAPYAQPYAPPPPTTAYSTITNETDPTRSAQQDRRYAYERGQELDIDLQGDQQRARSERDIYGGRLKDVYDPMVDGRGGLTQEQLASVTREGDLSGLGMTEDEINNNYLTMDERLAIQGDPRSRHKYFDPNRENTLFDEGRETERAAVSGYQSGLDKAFNPATLRSDPGFSGALRGGVDQYSSSLNEALDPNALSVSDEFLSDYQLTPEEQQRIVTSAATTVGTRDKAAIAEAERRSRAAGMNPLGVAALRNRSERERSANAADAMTSANIGAESEAARRMQTGEAMRLGARQNLAGMQMDAAGNVMDAGYRATTTGENARVAGERDIADRRTYAADRGGQALMGSEADLAKRRLALQQDQTRVGNEAERDVENVENQRNVALATNRLENERYVQGQRYNRGVGTSDRLSDRYRYGVDATRGDAQEGRGYYTQQGNQANANYNTAVGARQNIYGTQAGAGQAATRTQAGIEQEQASRPKWYDKLIGAASGAARSYFAGGFANGGMVTEPTYALLGESGPEMVIPLDSQSPEVLPSMAMRPGQAMPFATAPPPMRPKPAYSQQYRYGA